MNNSQEEKIMNYQQAMIDRVRYNLDDSEEYLFEYWDVEITDEQLKELDLLIRNLVNFSDVESDED